MLCATRLASEGVVASLLTARDETLGRPAIRAVVCSLRSLCFKSVFDLASLHSTVRQQWCQAAHRMRQPYVHVRKRAITGNGPWRCFSA